MPPTFKANRRYAQSSIGGQTTPRRARHNSTKADIENPGLLEPIPSTNSPPENTRGPRRGRSSLRLRNTQEIGVVQEGGGERSGNAPPAGVAGRVFSKQQDAVSGDGRSGVPHPESASVGVGGVSSARGHDRSMGKIGSFSWASSSVEPLVRRCGVFIPLQRHIRTTTHYIHYNLVYHYNAVSHYHYNAVLVYLYQRSLSLQSSIRFRHSTSISLQGSIHTTTQYVLVPFPVVFTSSLFGSLFICFYVFLFVCYSYRLYVCTCFFICLSI